MIKQNNIESSFISISLLYSCWILASLILSIIFSSIIYSVLTIPEYERPIDTLEDLLRVARDRTKSLIVRSNVAQWNEFLQASRANTSAQSKVFRTIGTHLRESTVPMLTGTLDMIPRVEQNPKIVALGFRIGLEYRRQMYATMALHIGSGYVEQDMFGLALRKGSPLLKPFNVM